MRNKLILILLTVFVVGSIAGITALSTLKEDNAAVGKSKIDTKISSICMSTSPYHTSSNPLSDMDGYLRDKNGEGIGGKRITITTSGGKTFTTESKGTAGYFFQNKIPVGETITVKFAGDSNYNPSEVSFFLKGPCDPSRVNW